MVAEDQTISTVTGGEGDDGHIYEASVYSEEPIGSDYALIGSQWIESAPLYGGRGYRAETTVFLKRKLDDEGRFVSALQGGIVWRSDLIDCTRYGAELRYLAGMNLANGAFINAELAVRSFDGDCTAARIDLTAGYRPEDNWLALGQIFSDAPRGGEDSLKLQISAVRFAAEGWGVQFGLRAPVDGDEGPLMLVLGVWD